MSCRLRFCLLQTVRHSSLIPLTSLAVRPLKTTIQPSISTVPCKTFYLLANLMLFFPMFSTPAASPTNRSPLPRPFHSNRCHPERSEGSAFRISPYRVLSAYAFASPDFYPFNFRLSTVNHPSLSPFPATLTDNSQLTENPATLSPLPATLTSRVKPKSFICHSYKKTPGVGVCPRQFRRGTDFSLCSFETVYFGGAILRTGYSRPLPPAVCAWCS